MKKILKILHYYNLIEDFSQMPEIDKFWISDMNDRSNLGKDNKLSNVCSRQPQKAFTDWKLIK